jgi:hypothetical protein
VEADRRELRPFPSLLGAGHELVSIERARPLAEEERAAAPAPKLLSLLTLTIMAPVVGSPEGLQFSPHSA